MGLTMLWRLRAGKKPLQLALLLTLGAFQSILKMCIPQFTVSYQASAGLFQGLGMNFFMNSYLLAVGTGQDFFISAFLGVCSVYLV